jgi:hypothetical protein
MKVVASIIVAILVMFGESALVSAVFGPETCRDGWHSPSIGLSGACSHHGGVASRGPLYILLFAAAVGVGFWTYSQLEKWRRRRDKPQLRRMSAPPLELCQICRTQMVLKTVAEGPRKGREYWECFRAPKCKGRRWV